MNYYAIGQLGCGQLIPRLLAPFQGEHIYLEKRNIGNDIILHFPNNAVSKPSKIQYVQ
jgi:hypothetical protein